MWGALRQGLLKLVSGRSCHPSLLSREGVCLWPSARLRAGLSFPTARRQAPAPWSGPALDFADSPVGSFSRSLAVGDAVELGRIGGVAQLAAVDGGIESRSSPRTIPVTSVKPASAAAA